MQCPPYLLCSRYPSAANQVSDDSLDDVFTMENPVVSVLAGVPGAAVHVAGAVRDPD